MTKTWHPKRDAKRYDKAGAVVLNRVKLGQAPVSLYRIRWMHIGLWVILTLAVVGGGLGLWLTVDSRFYIYDARIVGNRRLSQEEIFDASGLRGLHILWARSGTIEASILEAQPSLKSVEASCRLPSTCEIAVVERRPRVLWDENGTRWWIDEQGAVFSGTETEGVSDGSGRWLISGPLPRDAEGNLDDEVRVGLAELWESGWDLPDTFQYGPAQGLSFVDEHGWRIVVGQGSGMVRRLRVMEDLVAHLEAHGVTPRFVDVRFSEVPYYAPGGE